MQFLDERLPKRFWDKVIPEPMSGCWLFIGADNGVGYGVIRSPFEDRNVYAHRLTYSVEFGEPKLEHLDHRCRVRCCCNPHHVEDVTHRTNLLRGETWAAANVAKTHCPAGHELKSENLCPSKHGYRKCKRCDADRHRAARKVRAHRNPAGL